MLPPSISGSSGKISNVSMPPFVSELKRDLDQFGPISTIIKPLAFQPSGVFIWQNIVYKKVKTLDGEIKLFGDWIRCCWSRGFFLARFTRSIGMRITPTDVVLMKMTFCIFLLNNIDRLLLQSINIFFRILLAFGVFPFAFHDRFWKKEEIVAEFNAHFPSHRYPKRRCLTNVFLCGFSNLRRLFPSPSIAYDRRHLSSAMERRAKSVERVAKFEQKT